MIPEIEVEKLQYWLDEAVHDMKSNEAAKINNQGIEAQLAYLGITREYALKASQER